MNLFFSEFEREKKHNWSHLFDSLLTDMDSIWNDSDVLLLLLLLTGDGIGQCAWKTKEIFE